MKFRAIIDNEIKHFTLRDIAIYGATNVYDPYCDMNILLTWLAAGNEPDRFTGIQDSKGMDIYENDILEYRGIHEGAEKIEHYKLIWSEHLLEYCLQAGYKNHSDRKTDLELDCYYFSWPSIRAGNLKLLKVIGNTHQNTELVEGLK